MNFCFRYNGMLGDFPVNSHDISTQMMSKFLANRELSRIEWPPLTTPAIKSLISDSETRGTISTIGNDITDHANIILSDCFQGTSFSLDQQMMKELDFSGCITEHFTLEMYDLFKSLYQILFPIPQPLPNLHRKFDRLRSITYKGEHFQPDQESKVNCNIIRARWLKADYSGTIDSTEKLARAGAVRDILITSHTLMGGAVGSVTWLKVDWFNMHHEPYALGNATPIYHMTYFPDGNHSYVPIQRVVSKCAIRKCQHQNIDVNLIIPIPGQWGL